ncbi:MAG TPA: elongation factor G [Anaerolineae bacterium]|nr:elongation factor G [Anaerolineae bacterium]
MKDYKADQLRNVVLLGHSSSGKTSLTEALLYDTGATSRMGRVEDGTTVSDYDEEEKRRKISVNTSIVPCEWQGHKINLLDTPGYADFVGEVKGAVRVADGAMVLVDAASGVEVGTELVWNYADEQGLPRLVFINKMDRENANFQRVLDQLKEVFAANFIPVQLPIGAQSDFRGVVDLVRMRAYLGEKGEEGEIPAALQDQAESYHHQLIEAAAEADDELIMKYLEGEELTLEEIQRGLKIRIKKGALVPILCGSALTNQGIQPCLDALVAYLPSPTEGLEIRATNPATGEEEVLEPNDAAPLTALVFKTMADPYVGKLTYFRVYSGAMESDSRAFNPRAGQEERIGQLYLLRGKEQTPVKRIGAGDIGAVAKLTETRTGDTLCDRDHPLSLPGIEFPAPVFSAAITPKTKADLDKMGSALARLVEEDPTLRVEREPDTGETILSGMGESHIDIAARRLKQKFGVSITTAVPKVPYKETITQVVQAHGRHKKQTGGRGQFGDVWIRFEPLPRGAGFEFVDEIRGGVVPSQYIPAVEKGLREIMRQGVLAGYPVVDYRAILYDGTFHPVDSSEISFKLAAHLAFKDGIPKAGPVLLEPIMNVAITVPEEFMGDVLGDLNAKRARVQGMDQRGGLSIIRAQVPLAEMLRYATDLRSMTQGRGLYTMEFSHYEEVPPHIAQGIIEQAREEKEGGRG